MKLYSPPAISKKNIILNIKIMTLENDGWLLSRNEMRVLQVSSKSSKSFYKVQETGSNKINLGQEWQRVRTNDQERFFTVTVLQREFSSQYNYRVRKDTVVKKVSRKQYYSLSSRNWPPSNCRTSKTVSSIYLAILLHIPKAATVLLTIEHQRQCLVFPSQS